MILVAIGLTIVVLGFVVLTIGDWNDSDIVADVGLFMIGSPFVLGALWALVALWGYALS